MDEMSVSAPQNNILEAERKKAATAALFNKGHKDFLKVHENDDVPTIARILYDCHPLLDVNELGKQFGRDPDRDPIWARILHEYAQCFDFVEKPIVPSLRDFLYRFRLPGESAQIGRVMEAFSHSYYVQNCTQNTEKFPSSMATRRSTTLKLSRGYYIRDVVDDTSHTPCCLHCGRTETDEMPLYRCSGCCAVTFCRKCLARSSRYGHAFVGRIGYGSACANTLWNKGGLVEGQTMEYDCNGKGLMNVKIVTKELIDLARKWSSNNRHSLQLPFANEDAVYVFSYSLIMLTTNLHNPNVKDKMTVQQFLVANNGINNGDNLPGDYLSACYKDIAWKKIEVMT